MFDRIKGSLTWLDVVVSLFLAFVIPSSTLYLKTKRFELNLKLILQIGLVFLILIGLTILARLLLNRLSETRENNTEKIKNRAISEKIFDSKYKLWVTASVILIFWLPTLLMLFPGTLINDSWGQLTDMLLARDGIWAFSSHHPMLSTIVIGGIILPIVKLFGSWHLAFFIYVLIQAVCTSLTFSYSIHYFREKFKISERASWIFLAIYCLFPIFAMCVQTVSKDAMSAWIYVLFIIKFIEIIRSKGRCFEENGFLYKLIAICAFCILTKKVEFYVIFLSLVGAMTICKKGLKRHLVVLAGILMGMEFLFIPMVQQVADIQKGGVQEMFSLPFQQTANYVKKYAEDVTTEEREIIDKVLNYENLAERYNPTDADPVKQYQQRGETGDYVEYLRVWVAQFFKHPDAYIDAGAAQVAGWFSYAQYEPLMDMNWHNQLYEYYIPETVAFREEPFASASKMVRRLYEILYSIPVFGGMFTFAFFAVILPFFITTTIFWQKRKYLIVCVPMWLSLILGCYLAPVSVHVEGARYLYPMIYTGVVFLILIVGIWNDDKQGQ